MKSREFQKLGRDLAGVLDDGYSVKGPLVYKLLGQQEILRGVYFEGSSFDSDAFYIWAFYLPLFVPAANVSFNLGHRLRRANGGDRWKVERNWQAGEMARLLQRDSIFTYTVSSVHDFIDLITEHFNLSDIYVSQALACAFARNGECESLANAIARLEGNIDQQVPWQAEILKRMSRLRDAGAIGGKDLLDEWKAATIAALRLAV